MKKNLVYIALLLLFIAAWYMPPIDPDFGWHYKYGEFLFKTGRFLRENIFSHTFTEYEWANSYWLAQLYFYITYTFLTPIGMGLITCFIGAASFILMLKVANLSRFETVFYWIILSVVGRSFALSVRPMFFSTVFLVLTFVILNFQLKWEKYLPLIFLVWANTHADFTLGLIVYGLFSIQRVIYTLREKEIYIKKLAQITILPIASILVTLINPYGIKLWETLLKETHPAQFNIITEWLPVEISWENGLFFLFILTVANLLFFLGERRQTEKIWVYTLCFIFIVLSIRSTYFIRHTLLITNLFALSIWNVPYQKIMQFVGVQGKEKLSKTLKIFIPATTICLLIVFARNIYLSTKIGLWSTASKYPYNAILFIKEDLPEGNMLNYYGWGGYLIWQLPEYKTFIDGRMASWAVGEERILVNSWNLNEKPEENKDLIEKIDASWALLPVDSKLSRYLKENGWSTSYEDDIAVVLLR